MDSGSCGSLAAPPLTITALVAHPDCSLHDTGWKHPEHQGRLPAVVRAIERDIVALGLHLLEIEAEPATEHDLLRVHTTEYLSRVIDIVRSAAERGSTVLLDEQTPVSGASWRAALAAAGTALTGVDAVASGKAQNAFCLARPPGRGASREHPGQFSLLNNVAIAAQHLREVHGVARVLIVDWGSGQPATAEIFADDPGVQVLTSVAQPAPLYSAFAAGPEWVLLSAEFAEDPHRVYEHTLELRRRSDEACGGRLVSVLEGGYVAAELGKGAVQHLRALAGLPPA